MHYGRTTGSSRRGLACFELGVALGRKIKFACMTLEVSVVVCLGLGSWGLAICLPFILGRKVCDLGLAMRLKTCLGLLVVRE